MLKMKRDIFVGHKFVVIHQVIGIVNYEKRLVTWHNAHQTKRNSSEDFTSFKRGKKPSETAYQNRLPVIELYFFVIEITSEKSFDSLAKAKEESCII
ncbi:hypothetical protein D3C72_754150 [compost metagenome]